MADTRGIRAGRAFVELGVSDKLSAGLKRAQKQLQAFGEGLRAIGTRMAAIGGAALAPLVGAVKHFADGGDALDEMAARTGVSVEALSELGFAADLAGADLDTLEAGIRKMQKTVSEAAGGSKSAAEALAELGISAKEIASLSPEQQFNLIAQRLSEIQDPTKRAATALEVFGKSGTRLLPMLQDGAKGLAEMRAKARELGLTVSTQTAKDAAVLADSLDILWRVLKRASFTIGSILAPMAIELANRVTNVVVRVSEWVKQNRELVVGAAKVAAVVAAGGFALVGLGLAATGVATALGGLASIAAGVGTALGAVTAVVGAMLSPIGLAVSAALVLGAALITGTQTGADAVVWLGAKFLELKDGVFEVVRGIADALAVGDIRLAADVLWKGLKVAWQTGIDALNQVWIPAQTAFVQAFADMWFGAQAAAEDIWSDLKTGWIETTSFFSTTWERFTSFMADTWNTVANLIEKTWNFLKGLFDDTFDSAAANLAADIALVEKLGQNAQDQQRALQDIEADRKKRRESEDARHQKRLEDIGKGSLDTEESFNEDSARRLKESADALEQAKRALEEVKRQAAEKRAAAGEDTKTPTRTAVDPLADLEDRFARIGQGLAKVSVAGTFNPAALRGLGGGDDAKRAADAAELTNKKLDELIMKARRGIAFQ